MILRDLAQGRAIRAPVALVVAHPDDETLGVGARMACLRQWILIHLTDGMPGTPSDRDANGSALRSLAAQRMREMAAALDVLGANPQRRIAYGHPDQESILHLPEIVTALRQDLDGVAFVLTHAYEHGHPDHDTAALAVHLACTSPAVRRKRATVIEFPSYHLGAHGARFGAFWRDPERREWIATLGVRERARKAKALECFCSQRDMLRNFPVDGERFRRAPGYDFSAPAPPPGAWYDAQHWPIDSRAWLQIARHTLMHLELAA
jgi:LmbE family N-acetylglucosaminyl deacetylase